jgi:hypothetical protein
MEKGLSQDDFDHGGAISDTEMHNQLEVLQTHEPTRIDL